jgi:hypothetical protein
MIHIMLTAFISAGIANITAQLANSTGLLTFKTHQLGRRPAYRRTFHVELYASCHFFHILFF